MPSSTLSIAGEIGGAPMGATLQRTADGSIREGPITLHMDTGPWDMMVAFKMADGIA